MSYEDSQSLLGRRNLEGIREVSHSFHSLMVGQAIFDAYLWQVGVGYHKLLLTVGEFLHYSLNFNSWLWLSAKRLKLQGAVPRELDQGIRGRC